jgi:hypothetical protein
MCILKIEVYNGEPKRNTKKIEISNEDGSSICLQSMIKIEAV